MSKTKIQKKKIRKKTLPKQLKVRGKKVTTITKKSKKQHKVVKPKKVIKKEVAVEPTPVKKPKKVKSSDKMYFTSETEDAVIEYNHSEDQKFRDDIYNTKIKFAFEKLVENVFNTFKFSYFETSPLEVQKETVAHLVANMHKFDKGKGKAFGYFSVIAKNYLIFQNNTNYKRFNQHVEIGDDNGENTCKLQQEDHHYKEQENREFIDLMVQYWEKNICKIFTKQRDINIANAVIELFRNSDRIDAFNKKALYLYIREISSCKTQQITKVINKMKNYQNNITKSYTNVGLV